MLSIGAAPITGYDPSQYGGVRAPLQCSVAFAPRRAATPRPIIAVRCCVRSVACGVACSPWAEPYASTNWLGRHQAGPSFVFCRPSLMFAGAYLLGFGRAISLKEPPCGLKGPLQIRIFRGRRGELQYSRAQTRHSPGYSLETALLPASKHLHIDQLNVEMGAPPRGNASAVAGMVGFHVGRPSTSRNALPGTGLTGCCTGRPFPHRNAPSAARSV